MDINVFQLLGDVSRASGVTFLLYQLIHKQSAMGISLRSQELYFCVFLSRYMDSFVNYVPMVSYVFFNRLYLIIITSFMLVLFYINTDTIKSTYDSSHDTVQHWVNLVLPCLVLSVLIVIVESRPFFPSILEILFTFSILLEAVALLPQIHLLYRQNTHVYFDLADAEEVKLIHVYLLCVLVFRVLYIFHWTLQFVHLCTPEERRAFSIPLQTGRYSEAEITLCSDDEPWNTHHAVIYVSGLLQAGSIVWFFWDLKRRGMAMVPDGNYTSSQSIRQQQLSLTSSSSSSSREAFGGKEETSSSNHLCLGTAASL